MKVLVICDQGNNRSVTIAGQLKYWGHDVIPVGLQTNSVETLHMLAAWADRIIFTERGQVMPVGDSMGLDEMSEAMAKMQLWDVGPDTYPRPLNKELLAKVKRLMQEHKAEYKQ